MARHAECRPGHYNGEGLPDKAALVANAIKSTVGAAARAVVEPPNTLERSSGKARRVINRRARGNGWNAKPGKFT